MKNQLMISIFVMGAAVFTSPPAANAQTTAKSGASSSAAVPRAPDGKPDLSGMWTTPTGPGEAESVAKIYGKPLQLGRSHDPWFLTPWAQAQFDYNQDPTTGINAHGARLELNPRYAHCIPLGLPQQIAGTDVLSPFEILQTPRKVVVLYEHDNVIRQIFTDGREHPKPLEITWAGHSIGHWEGDTLVVDTVGMRDETWLDNDGHVHSDQLRITERIHRVDHDTLQTDMTLEDPKALAKPWTQHIFHKLRPDWDLREEVRCTENIKRGVYTGEYEGQ
jgi:hypothetical protein